MKLSMVLSVIFASLMSVLLVDSCGPYVVSPIEPFNGSERTNETTGNVVEQLHSIKEYFPVSSVIEEGARRGLEECKRQFKDEMWNCSVGSEYLQKKLPFDTREAAFFRAISSAAVVHEFAHQCAQKRLPGCKCFNMTPKKSEHAQDYAGCGDDIEFGQSKAKRFFDQLEKGNQASRKAVNLHNSKVGGEVVRALSREMCKCLPSFNSDCHKTCWMQLAPFKDVGAKLKQKYNNAVRVWLVDNKLQERIGDQYRAIPSGDTRLVYLDPSPDFCVRNDTLGYRGMLGKTCKSFDVNATECKAFIAKCNACNLGYQTVEHKYEQVKCNCMFHWCCYVKCETCKKMSYITTCTTKSHEE